MIAATNNVAVSVHPGADRVFQLVLALEYQTPIRGGRRLDLVQFRALLNHLKPAVPFFHGDASLQLSALTSGRQRTSHGRALVALIDLLVAAEASFRSGVTGALTEPDAV